MTKTPLICTALCLSFAAAATNAQQQPPPPKPGGNNNVTINETVVVSDGNETIQGEVWIDNWFSLRVNGVKIIEDSVAYKTERSFNAERFTFQADLPMTLAFELRDFMENTTGLEYIGARKQQMGDGGAIAQFTDANGSLLAVTDSNWRCLVTQHAPVQTSCARESNPTEGQGACASIDVAIPEGWAEPTFDDSQWSQAVEHSAASVRPKDGYDQISWDSNAKLIWGDDLERDNILLCRLTVDR